MSMSPRLVKTFQVPEQITAATERTFLGEVQNHACSGRPSMVLDCSKLQTIGPASISLLLSSLEEAMKCNGDVRLACLNPAAEAALRAAGLDRLFEFHPSCDTAVASFYHRPVSMAPLPSKPGAAHDSENAA